MKKISIEEKARRYDEAIKRIQSYVVDEYGCTRIKVANVFPELKKSEDEKMREMAIKAVYAPQAQSCIKSWGIDPDDVIAWLEKQSTPQVRTGLEWVNTIDDACDKRYSEEYSHGEYCHEQSFKWGFQEGVDWLEKQGEQKPVISDDALREGIARFGITQYQIDNWLKKYVDVEKQCEQKPNDKAIKPKFKTGDWIIYKDNIWKICNISLGTYYELLKINNEVSIKHIEGVDKTAHLWTIQDAKDGDVLSYNDGHGNDSIELIKSITGKKIEFWFCLTNGNDYEVFDGVIPYTNFASREGATPATKEQRDFLFQKMKETGYDWDSRTNKMIYNND